MGPLFRFPVTLALLACAVLWTQAAHATPPNALTLVPSSDFNVGSSGLTVECWIKVRTRPGMDPRIIRVANTAVGQADVAHPDVWQLFICGRSACTAGAVLFDITQDDVRHELQSTIAINDTAYHHVAATYDGDIERIYVDGVACGTRTIGAVSANVAGGSLVVGNANMLNNQYDGWIDELRIWRGARSATQIADNRFSTISPTEPGLLAYWRFDSDPRDLVAGHMLSCMGDVTLSTTARIAARAANIGAVAGPGETACGLFTPACSNGIDDDGDGCTDYPCDPGCTSYDDESEAEAACPSLAGVAPLVASAPQRCQVTLSWSDVAGEQGYRLYRDGVLDATLGADVTSTTVRQGSAAPHHYRVYAFDSCHQGPDATTWASSTDAPAFFSIKGNYYEPVSVLISWPDAKSAAESYSFLGHPGHLATPTTPEENSFLASLGGANRWLGGYQDPGAPNPSTNWHWVTPEVWGWTSWANGEPNNSNHVDENYLEYIDDHGGWNDVPPNDPNIGYLIEYEIGEPLVTPGGMWASDNDWTGVSVHWSPVAGAVHYRVMRDGAQVQELGSGATQWLDVVATGVAHLYCVRAANECGGVSADACNMGVRVPPPPPPAGGLNEGAGTDEPLMRPMRRLGFSASGVVLEMRRAEFVRVDLFDVSGRRLRTLVDRLLPPGSNPIEWDGLLRDGRRAPAGVYFVRMQTGRTQASTRIVHLP